MKNFLNKIHFIILLMFFFSCKNDADNFIGNPENNYPDNAEGAYEDMLTPAFYQDTKDGSFRIEVNKFVYFSRNEVFHHPFMDADSNVPDIVISEIGKFGAGKGPQGISEHHPAVDIYLKGGITKHNIYAAYDGIIKTEKDGGIYRHYISLTKDIIDDDGKSLGKIVTIYGHVDLDLDEQESVEMNGQTVKKGDLISKNLYAGTMGGPHLHFETRYYRPDDAGDEKFYGFIPLGGSDVLTEPSAGSWTYGFWDPEHGYGYANPKNHGFTFY